MKKSLAGLALLCSFSVFAAPQPLSQDVQIKNAQFAGKIYAALEQNVQAVHLMIQRQKISTITIEKLITCVRTTDFNSRSGVDKTYSCKLLKAGWSSLGMESYGSGINEKASKALYAALSIKETNEEGIGFKTIELNVPDRDGGTERNQLSCTKPGKEASELGIKTSCQVVNAL